MSEVHETSAREAIEALQGHEAWAIIRRSTRAGDRDTVGLVGGRRSVVESILDVPAGARASRGRPHRRPAARDPVPAGRASAGSRRTTTARRWSSSTSRPSGSSRSPRSSRRSTTSASSFADRGGFDIDDDEYAKLVEADHRRRDRAGRGREPGDRPALPRDRRRLGPRQGADRLQAAARARARRVLDLRVLHRRPLPHRRQPRAARHRARRRRPDEPDQRHLPAADAATAARPQARALLDFLARREGDLRALHGRRRGAEDDVRHLHRGRPGARAVPQADEPPHPHRVPPRRPHHPRPARGAARHDVRRHGHRLAGRERLPADQAVRDPRAAATTAPRSPSSAATPTAGRSSTARS